MGLVCNMKSMYCYLKCKFKDCKYEHWFKYTKGKDNKPEDIKFERSINMNHSIKAHMANDIKGVEFL